MAEESNYNDKDDEEYLSCEYLQGGLNFHAFNISTCNFWTKGLIFYELNGPDGKKTKIDFNEIDKIRRNVIEKREIPDGCKGCFNLKKKKWKYTSKISILDIDHWQDCNCGCIYCSNLGLKYAKFLQNGTKKSEFYDVYPILEEIYNQNKFAKKLKVSTAGGEPANLEEYPDIVRLLLKNEEENGCDSEISYLTSGIKYIPEVAAALEKPNKFLTTSLDCGCRETYLKIKRTDAFDDCIKNLKEYISHAKDKNQVILKYIFLPNINDNVEEIDKFFEVVKNIGCKNVSFALEFCQALRHKKGQKIPKNLYGLFDYAEKKAKDLNINYFVFDIVKDLLEKGHY